jgi:hypothetical protein
MIRDLPGRNQACNDQFRGVIWTDEGPSLGAAREPGVMLGKFKMPTVARGMCGCALSSRPAAAKGPASMTLLTVLGPRMVCTKCGFAQCTTPKDDHVLAQCSTETRRTRDTLADYVHLGIGRA